MYISMYIYIYMYGAGLWPPTVFIVVHDTLYLIPRFAWVGKFFLNFLLPGFWPNPGPGRRPLDSDRRDAEFACVFASVAFLTVSFVPKSIFWNPEDAPHLYVCSTGYF